MTEQPNQPVQPQQPAQRTLTETQAAVLDYIRDLVAERSYPPSYREIMARFGIRSPSGVACHLRALVRKGFLGQAPGQARALWPVPSGQQKRAEGGKQKANAVGRRGRRAKVLAARGSLAARIARLSAITAEDALAQAGIAPQERAIEVRRIILEAVKETIEACCK